MMSQEARQGKKCPSNRQPPLDWLKMEVGQGQFSPAPTTFVVRQRQDSYLVKKLGSMARHLV